MITGGTGFIGKALLRYLKTFVNDKTQISVVSRNPDKFIDSNLDIVDPGWINILYADVTKRTTLPWDQSFSQIIHAATESTNGPKLSPIERYQHSFKGCKNILDLAIATGAQKFLFLSSGGVYGEQPISLETISETYQGIPDITNPNMSYSMAKMACEHMYRLYSKAAALSVVIARCFSFVGPDLPLRAHFAIGNFIADALYENQITINGDGKNIRSYLDQHDLARWLIELLFMDNHSQVYNVGSDHRITIDELALLVRDLLAPEKEIVLLNQPGDK